LNYADDFDRLAAVDKAWDKDTMTSDRCHAMPNYEVDPEDWCLTVRNYCAECLEYAISGNVHSDREKAIYFLAVAIHIVADDYSHRQVNGDMAAHARQEIVPEGNGTFGYTTPWVDNYRSHPEQFEKAKEAARRVHQQYVDGNESTTTAQLQNAIDGCFPIIDKQDQPNPPNDFTLDKAFGGQ